MYWKSLLGIAMHARRRARGARQLHETDPQILRFSDLMSQILVLILILRSDVPYYTYLKRMKSPKSANCAGQFLEVGARKTEEVGATQIRKSIFAIINCGSAEQQQQLSSSRHQKQQQFLHCNYSPYTFSSPSYNGLQSQVHFRMHSAWEFSLLQAP